MAFQYMGEDLGPRIAEFANEMRSIGAVASMAKIERMTNGVLAVANRVVRAGPDNYAVADMEMINQGLGTINVLEAALQKAWVGPTVKGLMASPTGLSAQAKMGQLAEILKTLEEWSAHEEVAERGREYYTTSQRAGAVAALPKKLAGLPGQAAHLFDYKSPTRIEYPPEKTVIAAGVTLIRSNDRCVVHFLLPSGA